MANKNTSPKKKTTQTSKTSKASPKKAAVATVSKTAKSATKTPSKNTKIIPKTAKKTQGTDLKSTKLPLASISGQKQSKKSTSPASESKTSSKAINQNTKNMKNETQGNQTNKIIAAISSLVLIGIVLTFSFGIIPDIILRQTDDAKIEKQRLALEEEQKAEERKKQEMVDNENKVLTFENQTVVIQTSAGDLHVDLNYDVAPQTVENFLRLSHRNYYDNTNFFEIQKSAVNNVVVGGTQEINGLEGESSTGERIPDEFWDVQPIYNEGILANEPTFKAPQYIDDVDLNALNTITYKKGVIAMSTEGINLGQTRFFITLTDSSRPPGSTIFGRVQEQDFDILDSILTNFNPAEPNSAETTLVVTGIIPELKIKDVLILKLNEGNESKE